MVRTFTRTITTPAAARMVRPGSRPFLSLLTDFGSRDPSAGIMRAVVLGICPEAAIVDISHDVEKYRVRDAALLLWSAAPYLPVGAHVAVVDPGVGTERRAVAMETARGDHLVGPDNGLLMPAAARLGGIVRVHQLDSPQYRLPVISSSFHGRDIFAPAAAHLVMGVPLEFMGPAIDPRSLRMLDWPEPQVHPGVLVSSVIYLDTFGNVKLSALVGHLFGAMGQLGMGEPVFVRVTDAQGTSDLELNWVDTFGNVPPGQALLYEDSYGRLTIAVNQGSAAELLSLREDAEVVITRAPLPPVMGDQQWFDGAAVDPALMGPAGYDPNAGHDPNAAQWQGTPDWLGDDRGPSPEGSEPVWSPPPTPEPDRTVR
ncbi:MAG: SAM-dependent chlorinase/fluorinase [Chloroflexi bacterium]|nr:SAM-dependent chlorinase/fluorinase [Chloroflexota bacterium]